MELGHAELLTIFVIAFVVFGGIGRVSKITGEFGKAVRNFRRALHEGNTDFMDEVADPKKSKTAKP